MYSSVNNHDKSKSILSLGELLGIISVFAFVLYLLFPKGNIEEFLETQGHNNNLSIHYLKSMILYHPDNIELKMILMKKYTQSGKEKEALALNRKLIKNTSNKERLISLKKIEYLLEKKLYFQNTSEEKLINLKEKLLAYYVLTTDKRDYLFFFAESNSIDYNDLKHNSLQHLMEEMPEIVNYELVKMAYELASTLGHKNEAYVYLKKLSYYPEIDQALTEYLIYSLFEHGEFKKAKQITTQLFLKSQTDDERTQYFHLALHALVQDRTKSKTEVSQLIQEYANVKALLAPDISIILNTLLELGDSKEAANFAINMFYSHPENFDETGIDLALQSLLYNAELEQARALSFFAQSKFKKQKYLDKTIQITAWLGETEAVSALNKKGYFTYKDKKYEKYFLDNKNLDDNYEILGQIYQKKIGQAQYTFLDNLADYYDYTGEVAQAERYFTQVHTKNKHKKATYYAIEFSYKNSHFEKGLELYKFYLKKYGKDSKLHELSIKKLLALKRFEEAYAMSKTLDEPAFLANKQTFTDLAWMEKDYAYLHQKFWDFEKKEKLENHNFEQLILLEKALNQGKKLDYLYRQAWERTHNPYHLSSLFYKLLQEKKLNEFNNLLSSLSNKEQNIIHKNID
ncbi:MAG: Extracellular Matrix protein PelB, partial [uncultured Sulfurovum sp.]